MSLDVLYNSHNKQSKLNEFKKQLKENPLQVSAYRNLINDNSDLDSKVKTKMMVGDTFKQFKNEGLIVDDVPQTYMEWKAELKEKNPEIFGLQSSVMKQMNSDEFKQLQQVQFAVYPDVDANAKISSYSHSHGLEKIGSGIAMSHEELGDMRNPENIKKWNKRFEEHRIVKVQIKNHLNEINSNLSRYKQFYPLKEQE